MDQNTGLKRKITDKYYTSGHTVNLCVHYIKNNIVINKEDLCIEPSAGNGAFINALKLLSDNYKFYDLYPENEEIIKQDYLNMDTNNFNNNNIHIIGNPPFGRQSSLAIKFIKKSVQYCKSISFILPKSFKKESLKKHFPLNFHLVCEEDLPENSFIINNKSYNVPCVFQIWIKKDTNRISPQKLIPIGYKFVKKEENHDISFRRVGVNAGNISKITQDKSYQSHYFIKFEKQITDELIEKINNIDFNIKNNTVGPKSISKQELIKEFNIIMN